MKRARKMRSSEVQDGAGRPTTRLLPIAYSRGQGKATRARPARARDGRQRQLALTPTIRFIMFRRCELGSQPATGADPPGRPGAIRGRLASRGTASRPAVGSGSTDATPLMFQSIANVVIRRGWVIVAAWLAFIAGALHDRPPWERVSRDDDVRFFPAGLSQRRRPGAARARVSPGRRQLAGRAHRRARATGKLTDGRLRLRRRRSPRRLFEFAESRAEPRASSRSTPTARR